VSCGTWQQVAATAIVSLPSCARTTLSVRAAVTQGYVLSQVLSPFPLPTETQQYNKLKYLPFARYLLSEKSLCSEFNCFHQQERDAIWEM
jgi:hypothetical protein